MEIVYSDQQKHILDLISDSSIGVIVIKAMAGTGKTFTLLEAAKRLPPGKDKIFSAFNKSIVEELEKRLDGTGMKTRTFHSIGYAALANHLGSPLELAKDKYIKLYRRWMAYAGDDMQRAMQVSLIHNTSHSISEQRALMAIQTQELMTEMIRFMRIKLVQPTDTQNLSRIVDYYNLAGEQITDVIVDAAIAGVPQIMRYSQQQTLKDAQVDHTDMIYYPVTLDDVYIHGYRDVFVDECQDLNFAQRALMSRVFSPKKGGKIILVGDSDQAIYSFAGADGNSMTLTENFFEKKVKKFDKRLVVAPLTVTRRCAQVIAYHAAQIKPGFTPLPDAPRGKIVWLPEKQLHEHAQPGNMVICRTKAPLMAAAMDCLKAGHPVRIMGNDIAEEIIRLLDIIAKQDQYTFDTFAQHLIYHFGPVIEKWRERGDEERLQETEDMMETISILHTHSTAVTLEDLKKFIRALFINKITDDAVIFCTAHKSKGLEAHRVFLLKPEKMPINHADMTSEARSQEVNLEYVSITRAIEELVYLTNEKWLKNNKKPPAYAQETFEELTWTETWHWPVAVSSPAPEADASPSKPKDYTQQVQNLTIEFQGTSINQLDAITALIQEMRGNKQ